MDRCVFVCFIFFKQKTAYEMRISDWSSDVCSSDLHRVDGIRANQLFDIQRVAVRRVLGAGAGPQQTLWPRARLLRELLPARRREDEIGRASCRERVCQYV